MAVDLFADTSETVTPVTTNPGIDLFADTPVETPTPAKPGFKLTDLFSAMPIPKGPTRREDPMLKTLTNLGKTVVNMATGIGQTVGLAGSAAVALGPPGGGETNIVQEQGRDILSALNLGAEEYAGRVAKEPVKTLAETASGLAGPEVRAALHGDVSQVAENPLGSALQIWLAAGPTKLATLGATTAAASKVYRTLEGSAGGRQLVKPLDYLGRQFVPKYGWTPEFMGLEAETAGRKFYTTMTEAKPAAIIADELRKNPQAAPFVTPKMEFDPRALKDMNKQYDKFLQEPVSGPWGAPLTKAQVGLEFEYKPKKYDLHVILDKEGNMRFGGAAEFNALSADEQRKLFNIRNTINANTEKLWQAGILSDAEFSKGAWSYTHQTYRVFHNEADWINELRTNPATNKLWTAAHTKIGKTLRDPLDQTKPATPEQVDDYMWSLLRQARDLKEEASASAVRGAADSAITALIKRKDVPPEIKDLLGRMTDEFLPVRVGETIAMQNSQLITDAMRTRMETMVARDGRPLIIRPKAISRKPQKVTPTGPFWTSAETRPTRYRKLGTSYPDYVTLNVEGGAANPMWSRKWSNAQVHPDVIDAIHTLHNPAMAGVFSKYLQLWKAAKVADNPPTHINNMIGDVGYTTLMGASFANPQNWGAYREAFSELVDFVRSNGTKISPELAMHMQLGTVRPGLGAVEMGADYAKILHPGTARNAEAWMDRYLSWKGQSGLSQLYDMEDQMFRYGAAKVLTRQGMRPGEAAIEVNKYTPSYDVTSPVGNFLRGQGYLGPLPPALGAFVGGPFTSFPMENIRISLLAAKEHPVRFMALSMMPLTMTALGMGASGLTINDYHEMLKKQPPYRQGQLLIPSPTPSGRIAFTDITNAVPGADMNLRKEAFGFSNQLGPTTLPAPQGLMFSGPAWDIMNAIQNRNPQTDQPLVNPSKGETAIKWLDVLLGSIAPVPTSFVSAGKLVGHAATGTPATKYEEAPPSIPGILPRAFIPQLGNIRYLEELQREGGVVRKGRIGGLKGGFKSLGRDKTISPEQKQTQKEQIIENIRGIKEGFR